MNYREINWPRLQNRYTRWWRGELETPLIYLATWPDASANLPPRPESHEAVKRWFMDPETRMRREHAAAITIIGGFEGALDNTAAMRGTDQALFDMIECPQEVLALERRFLEDFQNHYYMPLLERLQTNPRGVSLWNMILMSDGPAHCIQSDFSCMVSTDMFDELGLWYVREQARMVPHTAYHLDGANALHHLPALLQIPELDCVQFIYQIPDGWSLLDAAPTVRRILEAGKRAEVFAWKLEDVVPFLQQVPPKGLKLNAWAPDRQTAEHLCRDIQALGYEA